MNAIHKRRLLFICLIIACVAAAASLALYALQQNIDLFYSPTQVALGQAPRDHEFRLGGLVATNSVRHTQNSLQVAFLITDRAQQIAVDYNGVLPDLCREGQAVVVAGKLDAHGIMQADQVLAKHDARYMPRQVKDILQPT
jgi:cytochrome c-type biogenesis protein CcmE